MRRLIVFEINEIPLSILEWYAARTPQSTIAEVLDTAAVGRTVASDEGVKDLYPSQTWASLATGVPYDKHGVYWYGDPKPAEYPLYWQAAAEHRRVGLVGTLHSSPFEDQCNTDGIAFAVPDVFGPSSTTRPNSLQPFQSFNQAMTSRNARAVASTAPIKDYLSGVRATVGSGVQASTMARLATLAAGVATGRVPKERLRTAQFLLMADVFESQLRRTAPDLGILFTNHVAAAMHRYWPASFPDDWEQPTRSDDWVARYRDEIPAAVAEMDRMLARLLGWCRDTDATLLLISSMGQVGGGQQDEETDRTLVVREPESFARTLGIDPTAELRSAMVPHLTYRFGSDDVAADHADRLQALRLELGSLTVDRSGDAVTVTYHLDDVDDVLTIDGQPISVSAAGLEWVEVTEHKAGTHDPLGSIVVVNSPTASLPDEPIDYLEIAPAILRSLDLPTLAHHREPTLSL